MRGDVASCVAEANGIDNLADLTRMFLGKIEAIGFDQVAYVQAMRQFRRVPIETAWRLKRMKPEWNRLYDERRYGDADPAIEAAMKIGAPFRLTDIVRRGNFSLRQQDFVGDMQAAGIDDFLVFPVSSRPGEFACFYFAAKTDAAPVWDEQISELESICLVYHARYASLVSAPDDVSLSPRETEVIELIAKGLTNQEIGESLGISANTVDTLVRRCFEKFKVKTRVEALLAAIGRGLILP